MWVSGCQHATRPPPSPGPEQSVLWPLCLPFCKPLKSLMLRAEEATQVPFLLVKVLSPPPSRRSLSKAPRRTRTKKSMAWTPREDTSAWSLAAPQGTIPGNLVRGASYHKMGRWDARIVLHNCPPLRGMRSPHCCHSSSVHTSPAAPGRVEHPLALWGSHHKLAVTWMSLLCPYGGFSSHDATLLRLYPRFIKPVR